jgi:hypothetical protein
VSLLSSIFMLVFSSIKFYIGFIDKNYVLKILESMPIKIFLNSKNSNFPCGRTLCIVGGRVSRSFHKYVGTSVSSCLVASF